MNAREIAEGHGFTTRQGVRFLLVASHKSAQRIGGHIERKAGCVGCQERE